MDPTAQPVQPQIVQQPIQPVSTKKPSNKSFLKLLVFFIGFLLLGGISFLIVQSLASKATEVAVEEKKTVQSQNNLAAEEEEMETLVEEKEVKKEAPHPLSIEYLRKQHYPGSDIVIEEKLPAGSNYERYIASYKSDGLKIYALLTVPQGEKPDTGWPVVIFNHGFIPPEEYRTTEKYIAYTDAFSRNGYIVFRSDYRGHGSSEGEASGGYGSNEYTIDVLNALASMKNYKDANPNRIGMWGHSMGGHITLRSMVVRDDIKAGVIWAGVVASYPDLLNNWRRNPPRPTVTGRTSWRVQLAEKYGTSDQNPAFWNSISSTSYLSEISGPLQLHHGTIDDSVPVEFSEKLQKEMEAVGKSSELFLYPGDDHNIANNLGLALKRSVEFFDKYLK